MADTSHEVHYQLTVGLRFRGRDIPALRALAKRDYTHDPDEVSAFEKAARAAETGQPLVVQCMRRPELEEIVGCFFRCGIYPTIEDLRIEAPYSPLSKRFRGRA